MRSNNHFDKLIVVFGVLFTGVTLVSVGSDLSDKNPNATAIAIGLLTSLFWLGIVGLTIWTRFATLRDQVEAERHTADSLRANGVVAAPARPEMPEPLKEILGKVAEAMAEKRQHDEHLSELAMAIARDVLHDEKRVATTEEIAKIEAAFHDQSDGHYLKVHNSTAEGMELEISEEPIEPETPAETAKPASRGKSINGVEKKLTKSQQRRVNAQKGLGALTDDEVREQKNAKRRAARAAKKAAEGKEVPTTTSTTTQPGQTSLV